MKEGTKKVDTHGLNTVQYKLVQTIKRKLYTKFVIYYNETKLKNNATKT